MVNTPSQTHRLRLSDPQVILIPLSGPPYLPGPCFGYG